MADFYSSTNSFGSYTTNTTGKFKSGDLGSFEIPHANISYPIPWGGTTNSPYYYGQNISAPFGKSSIPLSGAPALTASNEDRTYWMSISFLKTKDDAPDVACPIVPNLSGSGDGARVEDRYVPFIPTPRYDNSDTVGLSVFGLMSQPSATVPSLNISKTTQSGTAANQIVLYWDATRGTNYILEQSVNFQNWTVVTNTPQVTGTSQTVILDCGKPMGLFRLRAP